MDGRSCFEALAPTMGCAACPPLPPGSPTQSTAAGPSDRGGDISAALVKDQNNNFYVDFSEVFRNSFSYMIFPEISELVPRWLLVQSCSGTFESMLERFTKVAVLIRPLLSPTLPYFAPCPLFFKLKNFEHFKFLNTGNAFLSLDLL